MNPEHFIFLLWYTMLMVGIPEENKLSMYHEAAYINTFNIMNLLFTRFSHVRLF